jgi:hypothetical protein
MLARCALARAVPALTAVLAPEWTVVHPSRVKSARTGPIPADLGAAEAQLSDLASGGEGRRYRRW